MGAPLSRLAQATRPPTLRNNTVAKSLAAAVAHRSRPGLMAWTDEVEHGFIRGRQGVANIVELDARARVMPALVTQP